ncbi:MAG: PLP-dependent aminotransferase family protein [Vicinamibacterales bacterium]
MDLHVQLDGRRDLSEQIFRQLRDAILDGRLRPGQRLPPTRELARQLSVSRNTAGLAYEELVAEGLVEGRVGAGSYVTNAVPVRDAVRRAPAGAVHPRAVWRSVRPFPLAQTPRPPFDFSVGVPDHSRFPLTTWRRLLARELRESARPFATYAHPAGHPALRAAIAAHLGVSRAVRASADDVVVTAGAQQALDLIGRVLIDPGMAVAVEEPGYGRPRALFATLGAKVLPVPVDDEGLVVDALPARARLVYVTPSHQFPLGVTMSLRRRTALLAWAERRGAVVIEDDYDSEFRFGGRPLDPLQRLDRSGRVLYVGSFSKVLVPGLRLGFVVAPASLQPALQAARQVADWHGDVAPQGALARFIESGGLARHIRTVAREYEARYRRIAAAIETRFAGVLRLVPAAAGLHVAVMLDPKARVTGAAIARAAAEEGVRVAALPEFYAGAADREGLVIGFGGVDLARIDAGMDRLARAVARARRGPAGDVTPATHR